MKHVKTIRHATNMHLCCAPCVCVEQLLACVWIVGLCCIIVRPCVWKNYWRLCGLLVCVVLVCTLCVTCFCFGYLGVRSLMCYIGGACACVGLQSVRCRSEP